MSPYYGIDSITDLFSFHFSAARVLVTYFEFHTPVSAAAARTSSNVSRTRSPRLKRLKRLELLERPHLNDWNRLGDVQRLEPFDFAQDRLRVAIEPFDKLRAG